MAGAREPNNGSIVVVGTYGYYWDSSVVTNNNLEFISSGAGMTSKNRANGMSVRCIKD
jgi:hypothetical protein